MKKVPCSGPSCSGRRPYYEKDNPRGIVYVEILDKYDGKAFCSIECMLYANAAKVIPNKGNERGKS